MWKLQCSSQWRRLYGKHDTRCRWIGCNVYSINQRYTKMLRCLFKCCKLALLSLRGKSLEGDGAESGPPLEPHLTCIGGSLFTTEGKHLSWSYCCWCLSTHTHTVTPTTLLCPSLQPQNLLLSILLPRWVPHPPPMLRSLPHPWTPRQHTHSAAAAVMVVAGNGRPDAMSRPPPALTVFNQRHHSNQTIPHQNVEIPHWYPQAENTTYP